MVHILEIVLAVLGIVMLVRLSRVSHTDHPNSDPVKFARWKRVQARAYISLIVLGIGWPLVMFIGGLIAGVYMVINGTVQEQLRTIQLILSIGELVGLVLLLPVFLSMNLSASERKQEAGVEWPKQKPVTVPNLPHASSGLSESVLSANRDAAKE